MSGMNKKWGAGKVGLLVAGSVAVLAMTLSNPLPQAQAPALGEGPGAVAIMKQNLRDTYASMASLWNGSNTGLAAEIQSAVSYKRVINAWDEQEALRVAALGVAGAETYKGDQMGGSEVTLRHANGSPVVNGTQLAKGKATRVQAIEGAIENSLSGAKEVMMREPAREGAMSLETARLYNLTALGDAIVKSNPHLTISAIPGANKAISDMSPAQQKAVGAARAQALSAFKTGFVEAMVSLSSPEQAKSFGLPEAKTLADFSMKKLDSNQIKQIEEVKSKMGADASWGVVEEAIAYATAASRAAHEQTLKNPQSATPGLPAYSTVPLRIYEGSDTVYADSMKTSPSAALRVSMALKSKGTGLIHEIRIKSGDGHVKAVSVEAFRKARQEAAGVVAREKKSQAGM